MNRNRLNQMRQFDRGHDGLHQVIQMNNGPGGGAQDLDQGKNSAITQAQQLALRRKTMYTRTELLARGLPTTQTVRRSALKCPAAGQDWIPPLTPLSPKARYPQTKTAAAPGTPAPPPAPMMNQNNQNSTNIPSPRKHRGSLLPRMAKRQLPKAVERAAPMPSNIPQRMRTLEPDHGKVEQHRAHLGHNEVHSHPQTPHYNHSQLMNTPHGSESTSPVRHPGDRGGSNCSSDRRKIKLAKAIRLPDEQNKSFIYLCKPEKGKVKEILTPRKLRTSCEHLMDQKEQGGKVRPSILEEALRSRAGQVDAANAALFDMAPLMDMEEYSSSSASSPMNSPTVKTQHLRQLEMELEDRVEAANKQDLRRQLKEVRNRQCHLRQLEQTQSPKNRRPEAENQNQNLPALHHEIRMLQELGEKLEATLRVTATTQRKTGGGLIGEVGEKEVAVPELNLTNLVVEAEPDKQSSSVFYTPRTCPVHFEELPITRVGYLRVEHCSVVCQRARILGYAHSFGIVQEYRIETKTLNELKTADDSQCFYLPSLRDRSHPVAKPVASALAVEEASGGPLQCTNFRMLRENPNFLLQQLRPLSHCPVQKPPPTFNLLDQDQMFFNSLAYVDPKAEAGMRGSSLKLEREAGGGGINYGGGGAMAYSRLSVVTAVANKGRFPQQDQDSLLRKTSSSLVVHSTTQTDQDAKTDTDADTAARKKPETEEDMQMNRLKLLKKAIQEPATKPQPESEPEPITTKRRLKYKDTQPEPSNNNNNKNNDNKDTNNMKLKKKSSGSMVRPTGRQVAPESPIANGRNVEPKVRMPLLKTVLVGMVQVTVFLILIMAFTYPDISC